MKRCLYSILLSILLLGVLSPQTVFASQVYGHLYFANLMLETKSGKYIALQDSTRNAFYGGSIHCAGCGMDSAHDHQSNDSRATAM